MTTIAYRYGAKAPAANTELADEQMRLAHRYHNALIAIERDRREASEAAIRANFPRLVELESIAKNAKAQVEAARAEIAEKNKQARTKKKDPADVARVKELKAKAKLAWQALKAERLKAWERRAVCRKCGYRLTDAQRKSPPAVCPGCAYAPKKHRAKFHHAASVHPSFQADLDAIEKTASDARKKARKESGLYWGNYLVVEEAMRKAMSGPAPRFRRWTRDGTLMVQIQKGIGEAVATRGEDSRVRIDGDGRKRTLLIRARSDERKRPIFVSVPMTMHRALPAGAKIKEVRFHRRQIAGHVKHHVTFSMNVPGDTHADDRASDGEVGIDLHWMRVKDGLSVAVWHGSDGREGELIIPESAMERWDRCENLQSIRDSNRVGMHAALMAWLKGEKIPGKWLTAQAKMLADKGKMDRERQRNTKHAAAFAALVATQSDLPKLPDWWAEKTGRKNEDGTFTSTIASWKSSSRLAALWWHWKNHRFVGDELICEALGAWRWRDMHLWEWQANAKDNAVLWRKDLYRNFAAKMRREYAWAAVKATNYAELQRKPGIENQESADVAISMYRAIAAVGNLRQILAQNGPALTLAKPADTCAACGGDAGKHRPDRIMHVCEKCGVAFDRRYNGAKLLLSRIASVTVA